MKVKHSLMFSLLVLAVSMTMVSCKYRSELLYDESSKVIQSRQLKGFERIDVYGSPTVYYTQADTFSVRIEGPEKIIDDIITKVDGNVLSIRNKGKIGIVNITFNSINEVKVYVTSPDLVAVQLYGSGDFKAERRVDTDNMNIVLRGSGDIEFNDIICDKCTSELVGSGNIDVDRLESQVSSISLVGSGDLSIKQFNVRSTDISLRGSGDVSVTFGEGCLDADCSLVGSGDISLKGRLRDVKYHKTGSGDIDTERLEVVK